MRKLSEDKLVGIQVPNDELNPLRVPMLKRGRYWIRALKLDHLKAGKEYLYALPSAMQADQKPLFERTVVLSKKENILNESDSISRFVSLALTKPAKLSEIALQVCLFMACNPIPDLHLQNARFLDDDTDTLFFMDGEPIGAIAEASNSQTVEAIQKYDQGLFPILSLRKLQASIPSQLGEENIPDFAIQQVQKIFDEAIEKRVQIIIWERKWHLFKIYAVTHVPGLAFILPIFAMLQASILSWQAALFSGFRGIKPEEFDQK